MFMQTYSLTRLLLFGPGGRTFATAKKSSNQESRQCTLTDNKVDPSKPEPSVVIIGAGMAGLSVAHRLAQCGFSKFTVLEANDRPGGRIHSCWLGDAVTELGCQYIHGACLSNPVYTLAAQGGLFKVPLKRVQPSKGVYLTSDGRAIGQSTVMLAFHAFDRMQREAANLYPMGCGKEHGSLMDFFSLRIQQELQKFNEDQKYEVSRVLNGFVHSVRKRVGDDLSKASADKYGSFVRIPGGTVQIPQGFVGIEANVKKSHVALGVLAPLLKDLPDKSVKFSKPVSMIRWGEFQGRKKGGPRAIVRCCDGEEYHADYVVVTVSLGVLKEHSEKMFCPALPANKMEAIHHLGFGNVNKIFLDYDTPFWVWSEGGIKFAWSSDELSHLSNWTKGLVSVEEVENSKRVLVAYVCGPEAVITEHCSDEEIAEGITQVLRQFTGDASLPYPCTILRGKWAVDPYFCGCFSFMSLSSNVGHQCDLASPLPSPCNSVPPVLLFAGEATCAGYQSTIHGARVSGIREAERIVQLTKKFGGPPPK